MGMPMDEKLFEQYPYGQVALKKMGAVPDNFRLYEAGWFEDKPEDFDTMKITGAKFRVAKSGPKKGKLSIMVPDTKRTVYVTKSEIQACDAKP